MRAVTESILRICFLKDLTPSLKSEAEYSSYQSCSWQDSKPSSTVQDTMISMNIIPINFFVARSSAFLLPPSLSLTTHPIQLTNSSDVPSTNGSHLPLNGTRLKCTPGYYGTDLDWNSCEAAWDKMPRSRAAKTYVSRNLRNPITSAIRLPLRYLSDDGACAIDVDQKRTASRHISDITTPNTLANRAADVIVGCVHSRRWGGYVQNFCMCKFFYLALDGFLLGVGHRIQQSDNRFC